MKKTDLLLLLVVEATLGILIMFGDKMMNYTLPQDKLFYMLFYLAMPILMLRQAEIKK